MKDLKNFLPLHLYGKGQAKDYSSLLQEIEKKESQIIWDNNRPIRLIKVCRVRVICGDQELYEDRQVFSDGRVRKRGIRGLAEKLFKDEKEEIAAKRALKEELGLSDEASTLVSIHFNGIDNEEKESPSYPGLKTRYLFWDFIAYLPVQYWQEEFVEGCEDDVKQTYFVWRKIADNN
ncbi:hypothetical protein Cri9333_0586 [Crinalium epipsammum PCC 9333]|uniref:NUDIX hydrolase n=2 Tax=Crinalium TaxID=241421 RepID=K9VVN3_9CYAN|nr:hypothetical protein Cri9333_0586 [Crinalium epipsammum PCC 9333]